MANIQLRFPFRFPFKFGIVMQGGFHGKPSWAGRSLHSMDGDKSDEALERYHLWRQGKPDPHGIGYEDIL